MKHLVRLVLSLFLLTIGFSTAFAEGSTLKKDGPTVKNSSKDESSLNVPEEPPLKIGVVDWNLLLAKAPQAEAAGQKLEKEFQAKKDKLTSMQKEFIAKQEKIQRDRDVLSDAERSKTEKELTRLQQDLRHMDEELRADYTARHREEMDEFVKVVREVVDKLAREEKYDLILPQETAFFVAERLDISEEVIQQLTEKAGGSVKSKASKGKKPEKKSENKSKELSAVNPLTLIQDNLLALLG